VHFIVPLQEKYEELRRFLASVREAFLIHSEPIAVLVVYFPESSSPEKHIQQINEFKVEFPETKFVWLQIPGEFNRAKALQKGAKHLGNDSLLFFSDIDLVFRREFVYRCRGNTIRGKQVYMPLMFGQYNPDVVYFNKKRSTETNFVYTKHAGRWRIYSYGPVCIYGSDVMAVGGLNTNIKGWGKEDTDFASRVVEHGLTIFRAPDQGIVHVFHRHVPCDESLAEDQRYQCKMATLSTYAPKTEAVDYLIAKQYIE
jgi:chondroitin sulfate synthase